MYGLAAGHDSLTARRGRLAMFYAHTRDRGPVAALRKRRAGVVAISLLAAAALALTGCTGGGTGAGPGEVNTIDAGLAGSIDDAVANAMQLSGSSTAIVGVWTSSGEYVHAYGEGINANSQIRAAQASQPVMCALLLSLVEQGELKLDRKISKDLPRQVGIEGITYGQLCDATSGLADFKSATLTDIFANNPTRPWSDRELLAQSLAHSPVNEPGAGQQVSDTGSLMLARSLRQLTGTQVSQLLEDHVFAPAAMGSSRFPGDPATQTTLPDGSMSGLTYPSSGGAPVCSVPGEAEGETVALEPVAVPEVSPSMLGGAGATVTTVTDLKNFYERYVGGEFGKGSAERVTSLSAPPPAPPAEGEEAPAPPVDGWTFGLEKQGPLYGMSGSMTGTITAAYHDPAGKFSVVVTLNNSSAGSAFARALAFQLAALAGEGVEWTAEDQGAALAERAVCQPAAPAEEAPAE